MHQTDKDKIRQQLSAYMDGQLDAHAAAAVERALEADRELAAELERLRAVRNLVRALPQAKAPDDFVAHVLAQAERLHLVASDDAAKPPINWLRWVATAAMLLICVSVGAVIFVTLNYSRQFNGKLLSVAQGPAAPSQPIAAHKSSADKKEDESNVTSGGVLVEGLARADGDDRRMEMKDAPAFRSNVAFTGKAGDALGPLRNAKVATTPAPAKPESGPRNMLIYTDDLAIAERDVETALGGKGFVPIHTGKAGVAALSLNNFERQAVDGTVQYVVKGTPEQVRQLQVRLDDVRQRQHVVQSVRERPADANVETSGYAMGTALKSNLSMEQSRGRLAAPSELAEAPVAAGSPMMSQMASSAPASRSAGFTSQPAQTAASQADLPTQQEQSIVITEKLVVTLRYAPTTTRPVAAPVAATEPSQVDSAASKPVQ